MAVLIAVIVIFAALNMVCAAIDDKKALRLCVFIYWMLVLMYGLTRGLEV